MKRFLFIFLLIYLLYSCSASFVDDESKLPPGTKPEMLFGKWQKYGDLYSFIAGLSPAVGYYLETYEFTPEGGSITTLEYIIEEDKYREPCVTTFSNWCYDGKCVEFLDKKSKNTYSRWGKSVDELTSDYIKLGCGENDCKYYKIETDTPIACGKHRVDVVIGGLLQVKRIEHL